MQTKRFLTTEWSHLAMLNYEIAPEILVPHVPAGTELDAFSDKHFVSMVGFLYRQTRVWGIGSPGHRTFCEVNLRFYVRRRSRDEWLRGVVFVKEIVPRRAVAGLARLLYGENFVYRPMEYRLADLAAEEPASRQTCYRWQHGKDWNHLAVTTRGQPALPEQGSVEEFITEHYWGYTKRGGESTTEYRVSHPEWRVWQAGDWEFQCDVAALYGSAFAATLRGAPASAFLAEGSPVCIYAGREL